MTPEQSIEPQYVLINPNAAQLELQNSLNGSEWRGALSQEAYMRRERFLPFQGIAAEGGLKAWALVDKTVKPEDQTVLAGCETLRKRALVSRKGKVEEVTAYGIASVFTPPEHRGKKYASKMMHELGQRLPTLEAGSLFSVLYSDIGKTFYAREGWKPYASAHISLPPEHSPFLMDALDAVITPLCKADIPDLCLADENLIKRRLAKDERSLVVALVPDIKTIEWQHAREDFVSNELYKKSPTLKGVVATVGGKRVWAIFNRMWYNADLNQTGENALHIVRLVIEDDNASPGDTEAAIHAILRVAQHEAHEWDMGSVEIWNPSEITVRAVKRLDSAAQIIDRDSESIASLAWYGDAAEAQDLVWIENEKYGWC